MYGVQDGVLAAARELTIRREMLEIAEFLSNFSEVATQASHIVALTTDRFSFAFASSAHVV